MTIRLRYGIRLREEERLQHQEDRKITITDHGELLNRRNIRQEVRRTTHLTTGMVITRIVPGAIMVQADPVTTGARLTHRQEREAVVPRVKVRHPVQDQMEDHGAETN